MSNFAVHGKLGSGKTKYAVWCIRSALESGRRVAGNVNVRLDRLTSRRAAWYTRVPDKPTARDLEALGHGNPESFDEDRNGVLVLDELATWLNARSFADPARRGVLEWLVHSRKFGWDVYFLMQHPGQVDKQVREPLLEYSVAMRKLDRVRLPLVGWLMQRVGLRGTYPRGTHWASVRLMDTPGMIVDSVVFKGADLHEAYDTRQAFVADAEACTYTQLHPLYFQAEGSPAGAMRLRRVARTVKPKLPHVQALMRLPAERRLSLAARLGV